MIAILSVSFFFFSFFSFLANIKQGLHLYFPERARTCDICVSYPYSSYSSSLSSLMDPYNLGSSSEVFDLNCTYCVACCLDAVSVTVKLGRTAVISPLINMPKAWASRVWMNSRHSNHFPQICKSSEEWKMFRALRRLIVKKFGGKYLEWIGRHASLIHQKNNWLFGKREAM